jgi:hypothetical protein
MNFFNMFPIFINIGSRNPTIIFLTPCILTPSACSGPSDQRRPMYNLVTQFNGGGLMHDASDVNHIC